MPTSPDLSVNKIFLISYHKNFILNISWGHHGRMVVGFITTYAISAYHH